MAPYYASTSMREGIRHFPQPPWYFGTENKIKPSDDTLLNAASRYGYRGARDIMRYSAQAYEPPFRTRSGITPQFLRNGEKVINEYVPKIENRSITSADGTASPKGWPPNTTFVCGSPLKAKPLSPSYRNKTTVMEAPPALPKYLVRVVDRQEKEMHELEDFSKLESARIMLSRPIMEQLDFETKWKDHVNRTANTTLLATMGRELLPCQKHGLMDPSDAIRSTILGSMSIIVHSQSSQEFQFRYRMQQNNMGTPYTKLWKLVMKTFFLLRGSLRRDTSLTEALFVMGTVLQQQARRASTGSLISKVDFLKGLQIKTFEGLQSKQLSQLYSVFDQNKKSRVRFASIVAAFRVLHQRNDRENSLVIIAAIWDDYERLSADLPPIDRALAVLTTACASDEECKNIKGLFKTEYQVVSFHTGLTVGYEDLLRKSASALKVVQTSQEFCSCEAKPIHLDVLNGDQEGGSNSSINGVSKLPMFSVCGSFISKEQFISVLVACPKLVDKSFDLIRARYKEYTCSLGIAEAI